MVSQKEMTHAASSSFLPLSCGHPADGRVGSGPRTGGLDVAGLWELIFSLGFLLRVAFCRDPMLASPVVPGSGSCLPRGRKRASDLSPWAMGIPFGVGQLLVAPSYNLARGIPLKKGKRNKGSDKAADAPFAYRWSRPGDPRACRLSVLTSLITMDRLDLRRVEAVVRTDRRQPEQALQVLEEAGSLPCSKEWSTIGPSLCAGSTSQGRALRGVTLSVLEQVLTDAESAVSEPLPGRRATSLHRRKYLMRAPQALEASLLCWSVWCRWRCRLPGRVRRWQGSSALVSIRRPASYNSMILQLRPQTVTQSGVGHFARQCRSLGLLR